MKKIIFLFFLLPFAVSLLAQEKTTIIDLNGNEIYTLEKGAVYEYIFNGFIPIGVPDPNGLNTNSKKWGIYDLKNKKMTVPLNPDYSYIGVINKGQVIAIKNNKTGLIEASTGRVIIPFEYKEITPPMDGGYRAANKDRSFCVFDKNGKKIFCKEKCEFKKDLHGAISYARQSDEKRSWGGYKPLGAYLIVNMNGKDLLPIDHKYDLLYDPFSDGLKVVERDGKRGYINLEGKEVIPCKYKTAYNFENGISRVSTEKDNYEYIDVNGNVVIPASAGAFNHRRDNYIVFKKDDKFGLLDIKGNVFMDAKYPTFESIAVFENGYSYITDAEGNVSIINEKGAVIMPLGQGVEFQKIKNDILLYGMDGKKGLLHVNGDEVLAPKYDDIRPMEDDKNWIVKKNDKYGIVSPTGKMILATEYDKIRFENSAGKYNDDPGDTSYVLIKGDLQGIYYKGKIIKPKYKRVSTANNGFIPVEK